MRQLRLKFPEEQAAAAAYCMADAQAAFDIHLRYAHHWPETEQALSRLTRLQGERGIQIDLEKLLTGLDTLRAEINRCVHRIPWVNRRPVASNLAFKLQCQRANIPPPASTAANSPVFKNWLDRHAAALPWVASLLSYRSAHRMENLLRTIHRRTDDTGRLRFTLRYHAAHPTGRWAGGDGFNIQNLNRDTVCGLSVRSLLTAAPGHCLLIADLSQIEPRCLAWLAGDGDTLAALRDGLPLYEAHARLTMGWRGGPLKTENPRLYALAKARVLGLGYGCGPDSFIEVARTLADLSITPAEARSAVNQYRSTNPAIVNLWHTLENNFRARLGQDQFSLRLPSGRWLRYFNPHTNAQGHLLASVTRDSKPVKWFGAKLTENLVQATARDVFAHGLLLAEHHRIKTLFTVHDEVVAEVPVTQADAALHTLMQSLTLCPAWIKGLPLAAEGITAPHYTK